MCATRCGGDGGGAQAWLACGTGAVSTRGGGAQEGFALGVAIRRRVSCTSGAATSCYFEQTRRGGSLRWGWALGCCRPAGRREPAQRRPLDLHMSTRKWSWRRRSRREGGSPPLAACAGARALTAEGSGCPDVEGRKCSVGMMGGGSEHGEEQR